MTNIPYPKYKREQKLNCKLLDWQIEEIRDRHKKGESNKSIARDFGVSVCTVWMWTLSDDQRKEKNAKRKLYVQNRNPGGMKKWRARKLVVMPELRDYERSFDMEVRKQRPNHVKSVEKSRANEKLKGPEYFRGKNHRFIEKWGRPVWNKYHYLLRRGIKMPFCEIEKLVKLEVEK